jgi:D-sedoheptulose 7-phosphate isomerase
MSDNFIQEYASAYVAALNSVDCTKLNETIILLGKACVEGKQIFICGNGGSASTASHFACDLAKTASYGFPIRFKVTCLADSIALITAYANDEGYETVFAEQMKNSASAGNVFIAISGSGNSPNVVTAMEYANSIGCHTVALTGRDGGKLGSLADIEIRVQCHDYGHIESAHSFICHMIANYFVQDD